MANLWPPEFQGFHLIDESMALFGARPSPVSSAKKESRILVRDLESGYRQTREATKSFFEGAHGGPPRHPSDEKAEADVQIEAWLRASSLLKPPPSVTLASVVPSQIPTLHGAASFTSSTTTLTPDKQIFSMSKEPLPSKKYSRLARNLRWTVLSVYRRLNFLVLLPNVLVMIIASNLPAAIKIRQ